MSASAPPGGAGTSDDPALLGANLRLGARLFASAVVFIFSAFLFAFVYLKSVNSSGDFRPAHVDPPSGFGIAILVGVLAATAGLELARRRLEAGTHGSWKAASAIALGLSVAVIVLQVIEYFSLGFKTASGGFASVFFGWTLAFLLCWLGAVYWIETLVALGLRGGAGAAEALKPSADGCVVYLTTLALVELITFVLLYLVK